MTAASAEAIQSPAPKGFTPGKFGMWLFIAADAMGFIGLIGAYIVIRAGAGGDERWYGNLPQLGINLTAGMTFLLILSSVTMVTGLAAIQKGDQKKLVKYLALTILGGLCFLGLQVYEWSHLIGAGLTTTTGNYAGTFFIRTGYHGAHVTSGVIYLTCVLIAAKKGRYTAESHSTVELAGLFWHFVDLVWIILFTIVYLM